jgi:hypothetical protein
MEHLLNTESIPALLGSMCVIGTLMVLMNVGKFVFGLVKEKNQVSEKSIDALANSLRANTTAAEKLEIRLSALEKELHEFPKFKKDLRRAFEALKNLSGEKWPEIRKIIMEDDFPL